jgi:hypothetical protein
MPLIFHHVMTEFIGTSGLERSLDIEHYMNHSNIYILGGGF